MRSNRFLLLFLVALSVPPASMLAAERPKPNILFVLSDDHALEAIGAYDSWLKDYIHTPTIEGLAAERMHPGTRKQRNDGNVVQERGNECGMERNELARHERT